MKFLNLQGCSSVLFLSYLFVGDDFTLIYKNALKLTHPHSFFYFRWFFQVYVHTRSHRPTYLCNLLLYLSVLFIGVT